MATITRQPGMTQARLGLSLTTPMLGVLLLFAGVALNPWSLARLFSRDGHVENDYYVTVILAIEALFVVAGLVLVRMRPRTPPLPIAILLALPLLAAGALGAYGGVLAVLPPSQEQKTMASMERSEVLYLAVTPTLRALSQSAQNLAFPDPGSHSLFAKKVLVKSDLGEAPEVEGRLDEAVLSHWPIAEGSHSVPKAELALWRPFFSKVEYFSNAKFAIVNAGFVDEPETRWKTQMHFAGLVRLASGTLAQVDADLEALWERKPDAPQAEPASWCMTELRTNKFELAEARRPYFDDVAEQVLRDPADRDRARTSVYDALRIEYFKNKTKPHEFFGHHVAERHSGLAVVDIDADGLDDLYLMDEFGKNMLFRNLGDGGFRDVAADYGLDIDGFSSSGIFADFDNDGDPDLVLGRTLKPSMYLLNEGGRFVDRSADLVGGPLPYLVSSVSAADYDKDGLLDVYFGTYGADTLFRFPGTPERFLTAEQADEFRRRVKTESHWLQHRVGPPNALFRNAGQGRFEVSPVARSAEVWRNTFQATWRDFDHDGDVDLFVVNDFGTNNLLRNDGKDGFVDVTEQMGVKELAFGMGASWGDYDNDGNEDVYVSNMYSKAGNRIMGMVGPKTQEFAIMARGNSLFRQGGDHHFKRVSGQERPALTVERAGWGWGSQFCDVNNDAYLDIFAVSGFYTAPKEIAIPVDT
jgi:VCBS repeat protein